MPIGPALRERLGRFEKPATEAYRSWFILLDDLAATLSSIADPRTILEIGCGAGHLSNRLLEHFPDASLVGSDICDEPGNRCTEHPDRTEFVRQLSTELVPERAGTFDLVVICDVLHHVPAADRPALVRSAVALCRPGGLIAIKDWEPTPKLANAVAVFADKYISGDRGVSFPTRSQLLDLVQEALPGADLRLEARIPPRRNNLLLVVQVPG
jgi:2-polyprenyl-6-hydroxyphenyl methylase/3-demethylubiquinone-9 3-methyltransferase